MLIAILLLKLISALTALKNNLKVVGCYLLGNLSLDVLGQVIIKYFQHYPKPYIGIGFILFSLSTFAYLANAAWLLFCAGWTLNNTTLKQVSGLALFSLLGCVLVMYPALHGIAMLTVWYAFYATLSLISTSILIKDMRKYLNWNSGIMLMLSLGCLADLGLVILFGPQHYWLVTLSNGIFYLAVLVACWLIPKYKNLLSSSTE